MRPVPEGAIGKGPSSAAGRARADGRDGRGGGSARSSPLTFTGAIIAGGSASRLAGRPKGLEVIGGARIIDRVAASLRPHCPALLVAPGTLDAKGWLRDAAIAPDLLSVKASITGIHACLVAAHGDIVALAWDMPFVPPALIGELAARLTGPVAAVVPMVGGRPEPLCAAYSKSAAEPIAEAVSAGVLRNADVLARLPHVVRLEAEELRRFGDPAVMFFNVNTPADLTKAEDIAKTL